MAGWSAALVAALALGSAGTTTVPQPDAAKVCDSCAEWNAPRPPFKVFGNTYYVGVAGLSVVVIKTSDGLVLLDGGLPQSATLVEANLRKLGLRITDVRVIANSHAHYDHAGGIAALQRWSGARVVASASGARALERGQPDEADPQAGFGAEANSFPRVAAGVEVVADRGQVRVGDVTLTAHLVPGHTPGSTTWTWRSCEGSQCLDIVYADSLNAVSAPGFRFSGDATQPSRAAEFRRSIASVAALPCDILLAVHPSFAGLDEKLKARRARPKQDPFVDREACRAYAADAARRLGARLAEEASATGKAKD
jgi:metallo-beta-lactamase class B